MKRMRPLFGVISGVFILLPATVARAMPFGVDDLFADPGIIVDRPPLNTGGFASDTLFGLSGSPFWQRIADDFQLTASASIRRITWWGFYNLNNPPTTETMRIRFYGARAGDGLPDDNNVIFEESFFNPSRIATGRRIAVGVGPDEFKFHVDLPSPLHLTADTPYWLEIAQIGDIDTHFQWEFSGLGPIGVAAINPGTVDWIASNLLVDNAFQLSTIPEPNTLVLCLLGVVLTGRHHKTRKTGAVP